MSIDPYSLCPCGSGKKLKFCCADLAGEMDKIVRMLEGDQPTACLEHIRSLRKKDPNRASLLSLQAMLENELQLLEAAGPTIDLLLAQDPANLNGLAEKAILLAQTAGGRAAIEPLQSAMERLEKMMPPRVHMALLMVGQSLLAEGQLLAARAHLLTAAAVASQEDPTAVQMLLSLYREPGIPLLFKDDWALIEADPQLDAIEGFREAVGPVIRGAWRKAALAMESLAEKSPNSAALWWNIGLCRSWLAQDDQAVTALKRCCALAAASDLDLATEASALAQLLAPPPESDLLDSVESIYKVHDVAELETALDRDPRAERVAYQPPPAEDDSPPPHSAYRLLDRAVPAGDAEITFKAAPTVLAYFLIFGRQTDRDARLEFVSNTEEKPRIGALLAEIGGSAIETASPQEKVVGKVSASQSKLTWRLRLPDGIASERRRALLLEQRRQTVFERWPKIAQPALDGQTPQQAAQGDVVQQAHVLGAMLILRETVAAQWLELDFNELRARLGLPLAEPIDPTALDRGRFPLVRADRLMAEKLDDDDLLALYRRASMLGAGRASLHLGEQIIARESLHEKADVAEVHGQLAALENDVARALDRLEAARQADAQRGKSCARWDLAELSLRLENRDVEPARVLIVHIQNQHAQEQGVMQALYQVLASFGALGPQGGVGGGMPGAAPPVAATAPEAAGEIWTPDGGAPAAAGEKKSGLWLPGMD